MNKTFFAFAIFVTCIASASELTQKNKDVEKVVSATNVSDNQSSNKQTELKETKEKIEILDALHISVPNHNPTITVMQYNIDRAAQEEKYENTKWANRGPRVIKLINEVKPDICCMQELRELDNTQSVNQFLAEFKKYQYVFSHKGPSKIDFGQATLYNPEKFFPKKSFPQWLSDTPNTISDTWNPRKDKAFGTMVLCTKFRHVHQERIVKNAKPLWVFNVHFGTDETYKTKSCLALLAIIKQRAKDNPYIVCGDFNFFPDKDGNTQRALLTQEMLDLGKDAKTVGGKKVEGTFVGFEHDNFKADLKNMVSRLDHIFSSNGAVKIGDATLYTKTMLDKEPEELTSRDFPSDHLPLIVSLKLAETKQTKE